MRINTQADFRQVEQSGGHFSLDKEGYLQSQSAFRHTLQKIADFFRALTPGGRAAIETRDAQLRAAMDRFTRQGTLPNVSKSVLPRSAVPPEALRQATSRAAMSGAETKASGPEAKAPQTGARTEAPARSAAATVPDAERLSSEIYMAAEELVGRKFPDKSEAERGEMVLYVCNEMQAFLPGLTDTVQNDPTRLRQYVAEMVNGLSGSEKIASGPDETARSSSLNRTHALTARDIRPDTLMTQGQNTCFMVSVINGMMLSAQGRRILSNALGPDGRVTINGQSFSSPGENNPSFSALEHSLGAAYQVYGSEIDPGWTEGQLGDALVVTQMFGLKTLSQNNVQDWNSGQIRNFLDEERMVLLFTGRHYMTVVGVEGDRLVVRNSLGSGSEHYIDKDALVDARLQVFSYPDE